MAKCVRCGAETILLVNGVPVCTDCDGKPVKPAASPATRESDPRPKQTVREQNLDRSKP